MPPKRKTKASSRSGAAARPAKRPRQAKENGIPAEALDVYAFGTGVAGELGFGPCPPLSSDPESHTQLRAPLLNPALSGVVQVSAGGMHCAALTAAGKILTWGANDTGNLGRDTAWEPEDGDDDGAVVNPLESTPTEVDEEWFGGAGKRPDFVQVVAIDNATFALAKDGKVWGWGSFRDEKGLLGFIKANLDRKPNPTDADKIQTKPIIVPGLPGNVKQLAGNTNHMLALTHSSQIWAWGGSSTCGELGRRIRSTRSASRYNSLVPTRVALPRSAAREVRAVYAGPHHSFAIDGDGSVFAWGANHFGQTGVVVPRAGGGVEAAQDCITAPTLAPLLGRGRVVHIAAGTHHSVACAADGGVWAWGRCDEGQVGLDLSRFPAGELLVDRRGRRVALLVPSIVPLGVGEKATRVAAGVDCSFAVTESGRVYAWGYAEGYRLGLPSEVTGLEPKRLVRDAHGNPIRSDGFSWAGCGGQFGLIAGPVFKDAAPASTQGGIESADADMVKAKNGAGEEDIVDVDQVDMDEMEDVISSEKQTNQREGGAAETGEGIVENDPHSHKKVAHGRDPVQPLDVGTGSGNNIDNNLPRLTNANAAHVQAIPENLLPDGPVERPRITRNNIRYLIDNPGQGDDDYDDYSSDGGSFAPETDDEDDTDEWMSGSDESEESDDSSGGGGAALASPSSGGESTPDEDGESEGSSESSGSDATPEPPSSSESEDVDYSEGTNDDNGASSGRESTPELSSSFSGSEENESNEENTEDSSDSDSPRLGPLPANQLVDGMGLPIPGLSASILLEGDDDDGEPSSIYSSEGYDDTDHIEQNTQPVPTWGMPLVDGNGLPVPGMTNANPNGDDDDEPRSLFSSEEEGEDSHVDQNARPLRAQGWSHVDGNGLPEPGRGYAPDFAVYAGQEEGEEDEDAGGAALE
ncbi:hypothetical protein MCOR14_003830 [Pyricularia oryzae]|nr:hypothetical protein MCOR14_003830 [Pyricularia oryzae]